MSREILFRGKRTDNGEWIEGFYAKSGDKTFILVDNDIAVGYVTMKEVIPETVGQYTGLTDRNGKRIFEGDIILRKQNKWGFSVLFGKHDIDCCGCCYDSHQSVGFYFSDTDYGVITADEDEWETLNVEVVGNRFDNPELLGSEDAG